MWEFVDVIGLKACSSSGLGSNPLRSSNVADLGFWFAAIRRPTVPGRLWPEPTNMRNTLP